jgi:hypothetical protein
VTSSAVLFVIFNRPHHTARTFAAIRAARPPRLMIHADGPRPGRGEEELCRRTRAVTDAVDWPCEVRRLYREENLGCGRAVSGAITEFFSWVPEGIVLEDDTLPSPAFFAFCDAMLARHRDDPRVFHIAGMGLELTPQSPATATQLPFPFIWGWASWSRAWQHYRFDLPAAAEREPVIARCNLARHERNYWRMKLAATAARQIDTWDYQWVFTLWRMNAVAITPPVSLVENIGHEGTDATHPRDAGSVPGFAAFGAAPASVLASPALPTVAAAAMAAINARCLNVPAPSLRAALASALVTTPGVSWLFLGLRRRLQRLFAAL